MATLKLRRGIPKFPKIRRLRFRFCAGSAGLAVDSKGGIWSCLTKCGNGLSTWHRLKPQKGWKGYLKVRARFGRKYKSRWIHRLVCEAFHGKPKAPKTHVNHKNGVTYDCRAVNLEWVTPKENTAHALKIGLFKPFGELGYGAKYSDAICRSIVSRYKRGERVVAISADVGMHWSHIYKILKGSRRPFLNV